MEWVRDLWCLRGIIGWVRIMGVSERTWGWVRKILGVYSRCEDCQSGPQLAA